MVKNSISLNWIEDCEQCQKTLERFVNMTRRLLEDNVHPPRAQRGVSLIVAMDMTPGMYHLVEAKFVEYREGVWEVTNEQ